MFFGKYAKSFRMAGNYAVVAIMVVFNLFYGVFAVYENIDNFGHFGGFFGGFVMAWLIYLIRKKQSDKKTGRY
jgi:membrane associated rhomboid family serine protease